MERPFKVVLLGEGRVGKTSLLLRFTRNQFNDKEQMTLQASFMKQRVDTGKGFVSLAIWDTAGQERFHALGPIYYRDANGAVLVYDITDVDSFSKVKEWVRELKSVVGPDIPLCIAGNKADKRGHAVSEEDAKAYAASVNATHFVTSAKTGEHVQDIFREIATKVKASAEEKSKTTSSRRTHSLLAGDVTTGSRKTLRVEDEPRDPKKGQKKKGGCC